MQDVYAIADNVPHTTRHRICAATMQSRGARTTPASEKTTLRRIRTPTPPNSTILQASSRIAIRMLTYDCAMSESGAIYGARDTAGRLGARRGARVTLATSIG